MKKTFVAIFAFLAISFMGAAENLPFGETAMRQYAATNTLTVVVQAAQFDPETGEETDFMASNFGIKFASYGDFMSYIRKKLTTLNGRFEEPKYVPGRDLYIYVAALSLPGQNGTFYYSFGGFHIVQLVKTVDGWRLPAGYIDSFVPKLPDYSIIRLKKSVESVKVVAVDKIDQRLLVYYDSAVNPVTDREAKVDSERNLLIRSDYTLNDTSKEVVFTVRFTDGTKRAWKGDGTEIAIPVPTLSVVNEGGPVLLLSNAEIGVSVEIECSKDLKTWSEFQTVRPSQYIIRFGLDSDEEACFFRIAQQ